MLPWSTVTMLLAVVLLASSLVLGGEQLYLHGWRPSSFASLLSADTGG